MEVRFRLEFERQVVEPCDAFKPSNFSKTEWPTDFIKNVTLAEISTHGFSGRKNPNSRSKFCKTKWLNINDRPNLSKMMLFGSKILVREFLRIYTVLHKLLYKKKRCNKKIKLKKEIA